MRARAWTTAIGGAFALALLAIAVAPIGVATAGAATAAAAKTPAVRFVTLPGYAEPGTPAKYDKVGVLETGNPRAKNVLVLIPGTSASAAYFEPLAKDIVRRASGWQVWSVERRENLLEDQSELDLAKQHRATAQQLYDYYLGYLTNPAVTQHFQLVPDSSVEFGKDWGMKVAVEDVRVVVKAAHKQGGKVVLGGHSLGGTITTAYATWDFGGKAGANGLAGLVFDDGGSPPTPVTDAQANASLGALQAGSPWLSVSGIGAPYTGLFSSVGSTLAVADPGGPSSLQTLAVLPAALKPPVPATNEAAYGYGLDTKTSPPGLVLAQAHLGQLAATGSPRGWSDAGGLTPVQRYADMFSGTGILGHDGTAWYHPLRLSIDAGAVADGNRNPAQTVLDVDATHGHDLPKRIRIYAFGAALGGTRQLDAARTLASQSGIPAKQVTIVDRQATYAHNDPAGASPKNAFLANLLPFLRAIG